ncbi:MAG: indole-3-glycerol phosphate synthase TrpC [Marinicellaceae bacterium]
MSDILSKILETKKQEIIAGSKISDLSQLKKIITGLPKCRGFYQAIKTNIDSEITSVIAEIKKASPSKGIICNDFSPQKAAISYEEHGATCLSVLTDMNYFQGHNDYLLEAKESVSIPVLRKDFIIDPWQVYESRVLGADCILLIVAALADPQLYELTVLAQKLGMDVLMEVHDHNELVRALNTPAKLIGINNRNLKTFVTSLETSVEVAREIPVDRIVISESGIHNIADIEMLKNNGINTFLIGEAFMRKDNPGAELKRMLQT